MQSAEFDYSAPAELFLAKPARLCRTKYRQFATAAEALRFAVEELRIPNAFGASLEVGDQRFNSMKSGACTRARPLHNAGIDCCPPVLIPEYTGHVFGRARRYRWPPFLHGIADPQLFAAC